MADVSEALVQQAIAGDERSLVSLLEAARPDIKRYARTTCHASDIDDAVQEALWLLYRRIGTLRVASAFSAWIFAIVRRECLRLARAMGGPIQPEAEGSFPILSQTPEVMRLDLARAIQSLPEHYRAVVLMRDMEQRTIGEIAEALRESREAVKARLHRARVLVREYLQQ